MAGFSGYLRAAAAALVIAVSACSQAAAPPPVDPAVIVGETKAFLDQWVAAREQGDGDILQPMYSAQPTFRWIENGVVFYAVGSDAAASLDMASTGGYTPDLTLQDPVITVLSDTAAAVTADYTMLFKFGGIAFDSSGVFTAVLVKEDGAWKFLQGHLSDPSAAEPPAPPTGPALEVVNPSATETLADPAPVPQ